MNQDGIEYVDLRLVDKEDLKEDRSNGGGFPKDEERGVECSALALPQLEEKPLRRE